MKQLPKTIYLVCREPGTNDAYLFATTDVDDLDDQELAGAYAQTTLFKVNVRRELRTIVKRK